MIGEAPSSAAAAAAIVLCAAACAWPRLRSYRYTLCIVGGVVAAMFRPSWFLAWHGVDLRDRWILLFVLQAVMFGMGVQMRLEDFRGIARAPRGAFVGVACRFTVMPLTGLALARLFGFSPEIAAGVVLVGSCSSGLASNVMAYFAGSNLALSVTVTALSTIAAPLFTPLLMSLLAGTLVRVDVAGLTLEIIRIVIVPIGAALLCDQLRVSGPAVRRRLALCAVLSAAWLVLLAAGGWTRIEAGLPRGGAVAAGILGYVAELFVVGWAYFVARGRWPAVARAMPVLSIAGIVYMTTVTAAAGRDELLRVGLLLVACSILHNIAGYALGYGLGRAARLDRNSCRSIAFEVGLQNGGMASALAASMGKLATVGLAAAMASAWQNISGSLLALYWRKRPVGAEP